MKCQPKCQKCKQNEFLRVTLIKQSMIISHWIESDISLVVFSQVVQKQTLSDVEN